MVSWTWLSGVYNNLIENGPREKQKKTPYNDKQLDEEKNDAMPEDKGQCIHTMHSFSLLQTVMYTSSVTLSWLNLQLFH